MFLSGWIHFLSTWKCYFSSWVWSWHKSLKPGTLFQSPLFNFPRPCVLSIPLGLVYPEGCPSPCLWHTSSTISQHFRKLKLRRNFVPECHQRTSENNVDVKGEERQKYLGKRGQVKLQGSEQGNHLWPLSFSSGEPQAMLEALQSKNKTQFVLDFHFSPLSSLLKSIFIMFL